MKAKALLIALTTTVVALGVKAQDKTTFGIRAGVNFQNLNGEFNNVDLDNKLKTGFNIGVNAEVPLAPDFYVQPGVLFTTKGAKANKGNDKWNISYIEIPINLLYKPTLGDGKLLLGFGPYIGIGLGGKLTGDDPDVDLEFKNDLTTAEATAMFAGTKWFAKRLDFGGNLLAGYELSNKLSFQLNAQLGMSNLFPKINGDKPDNTKVKNTGFGISVGYRF
jgi:hypothetical protein